MKIPPEFDGFVDPTPEDLLSEVHVDKSADEDMVPCLFFMGDGIELRSAEERRIAGEIAAACAWAVAEIERLRTALVADDEGSTAYQSGWHARDAEIERLRQHVTQRGARMQVMREWMGFCPSGPTQNLWTDFTYDRPEAVEWFDADGVPR